MLASDFANAQTGTLSAANIKIDHALELRNGGLIVVNDTVRLSTDPGEHLEPLQSFPIGFPATYRPNLDYCFAYVSSNPEERIPMKLDVGLGKLGFYGASVSFEEAVDISDGKSYDFTVVFVLSNLITSWVPELEPENALFNASFPMFPSLTQSTSTCNVTIVLPSHSDYFGISHLKERGLDFNETELPTRTVLNYVQSPLEKLTSELGWLSFLQLAPSSEEYFLMFDVEEVYRDIRLDEWGSILVSDSYDLTNKAVWNLTRIPMHLPKGAYNIQVRDMSGNTNPVDPVAGNETRYVSASVPLRTVLKQGNRTEFTVSYSLPWMEYVKRQGESDFQLSFSFFENFNWTIRKSVTTVTLPKGADYRLSSVSADIVEKTSLEQTAAFTFYNVTPFQDLSFDISYEHFVFWASFYPTLWIGLLATIVGSAVLIWRRTPRPVAIPIIPVSTEALRSFVDAYDEKAKISSELESIDDLLHKGRMTRRRYKIRKKTLDGRLSVLSRELTGLREEIGEAGPRYANIMGQVEVAEALLEGAKNDLRRAEARYRRGSISKSAYRKLISEYDERRKRARATIQGVLLRIREELH
jgi:hypothetical protein